MQRGQRPNLIIDESDNNANPRHEEPARINPENAEENIEANKYGYENLFSDLHVIADSNTNKTRFERRTYNPIFSTGTAEATIRNILGDEQADEYKSSIRHDIKDVSPNEATRPDSESRAIPDVNDADWANRVARQDANARLGR